MGVVERTGEEFKLSGRGCNPAGEECRHLSVSCRKRVRREAVSAAEDESVGFGFESQGHHEGLTRKAMGLRDTLMPCVKAANLTSNIQQLFGHGVNAGRAPVKI